MKRSALFFIGTILLCSSFGLCQTQGADPYKATLDKLDSLTHQSETEWRAHADVPHPEDPWVNDADWSAWTVKNVSGPGGHNSNEQHWKGTQVFRRWVQIPEKINGYSTQGSKAWMDLRFCSPNSLMI